MTAAAAATCRCRTWPRAMAAWPTCSASCRRRRDPAHDWRVLVIGGRARAAMQRVGRAPGQWVHNVAQGARCEAAALTSRNSPRSPSGRGRARHGLRRRRPDARPRRAAGASRSTASPPGTACSGSRRVDIARPLVDDLLDRRLAAAPPGAAARDTPADGAAETAASVARRLPARPARSTCWRASRATSACARRRPRHAGADVHRQRAGRGAGDRASAAPPSASASTPPSPPRWPRWAATPTSGIVLLWPRCAAPAERLAQAPRAACSRSLEQVLAEAGRSTTRGAPIAPSRWPTRPAWARRRRHDVRAPAG